MVREPLEMLVELVTRLLELNMTAATLETYLQRLVNMEHLQQETLVTVE